MRFGLAIGGALMGMGTHAQPPVEVDWIHDQILWHYAGRGIHINPANGSTLLDLTSYELEQEYYCHTDRYTIGFSASGEQLNTADNYGCLDVYGLVQMFSGLILAPSGSMIYATTDINNSPYCSTGVAGIYNFGGSWVEPITLSTDATGNNALGGHEMLASNGRCFIGGCTWNIALDSYACPNVIWKYPYPDASNGTSWRTCVDSDASTLVKALDLWNDTLLAVSFPKVIKVETVGGTPMGSFDLFNGATASNGHTCVAGDTLYWISQFGGSQLQVGKYLINSGPIWEVTLPFQGNPRELHMDGYNRLWTAVGNNIIWMNPADGSYQNSAFGQSVDAMDLVGNTIAIAGTTDGMTSYVIHGHVTP